MASLEELNAKYGGGSGPLAPVPTPGPAPSPAQTPSLPLPASLQELNAKYGGTAGGGAAAPSPNADDDSQSTIPWLLGGAAVTAALLAARRPATREALSKLWMGKNPIISTVKPSEAKGLGLPADLPTIWRSPETPVLTELERLSSRPLDEVTSKLVNNPNIKALSRYNDEMRDYMLPEAYARAIMTMSAPSAKSIAGMPLGPARTAAIAQYNAAKQAALQAFPPEVRTLIMERSARLPEAQWAKRKLGLGAIPEAEFPYLPRVVDETLDDVTTIGSRGGGLFGDLKTSLEGFQRARSHPTALQGDAAGVKYQDWRFALLLREWRDIQLINTAKFVDALERKGTLHATEAAAAAASPVGRGFALEGIPGAKRWFVPTAEEARLLQQNLASRGDSSFQRITSLVNSYFRQPNLLNPLPHFTKNMLYKYGLSGGSPRVFSDMAEYWRGGNPALIRQFDDLLPFAKQASTANETVQRLLAQYQPPGGTIEEALKRITRFVGEKTNSWSSRMIFQVFDPALRYARFKQYIAAGIPPQEAANHVALDLVRYGTRSDVVDMWKQIPFNMFVPWRLGTVTTLWKQALDHPVKTALIIGMFDYLREARYRQTGRWTHLPIDYIEGPISHVVDEIQRGARGETTKEHAALRATLKAFGTLGVTAIAGPGGGFGISNLIDVLEAAQGKPEWDRLKNMFFIGAAAGDLYNEVPRLGRAFASGDIPQIASIAANIMMSLAAAEHRALDYRPRRLMEAAPEWLPGLGKSDTVRRAEEIQRQLRKAAEHAAVRRQHFKDTTIDKRLERQGLE